MMGFMLDDHDYRGLSVSRLIRFRIWVAARYMAKYFSRPIARRRRLRTLDGLRGTATSREALVLGLGPSLNQLDPDAIQRARDGDALDIYVVNGYADTQLASEVVPDFYVLADPVFFDERKDHEMQNSSHVPSSAWNYLVEHSNVRVVIPDHRNVPPEISEDRVYYFNNLGLEGFTRNVDPGRARGFISMTAYSALAVAGIGGYKRILICGIENSWFRNLTLSDTGRVALTSHHAFDVSSRVVKPLPHFEDSGVGAFFEDIARLFGDLHMFRFLPIENLDRSTTIDAFPIADDWQAFSGVGECLDEVES